MEVYLAERLVIIAVSGACVCLGYRLCVTADSRPAAGDTRRDTARLGTFKAVASFLMILCGIGLIGCGATDRARAGRDYAGSEVDGLRRDVSDLKNTLAEMRKEYGESTRQLRELGTVLGEIRNESKQRTEDLAAVGRAIDGLRAQQRTIYAAVGERSRYRPDAGKPAATTAAEAGTAGEGVPAAGPVGTSEPNPVPAPLAVDILHGVNRTKAEFRTPASAGQNTAPAPPSNEPVIRLPEARPRQ
jgi:hypothetical protein